MLRTRLRLSVITLLLVFSQRSYSQDYVARNLWQPFVSVKYGTMQLGDVATRYHDILQSYRDNGVPIPTQTDFGRTVDLSGGFLYSPLDRMWLGASIGYSYSPAFSEYQDYAGTLKINGAVKSTQLVLIGGYTLTRVYGCPIRVFVKSGFASFSAMITENLQYQNSSKGSYQRKTSSTTGAPCLEMTVGTWVPVGPFKLSVEIGYRGVFVGQTAYSLDTVPEDPANPNKQGYWEISDNGFMLTMSIGFPLY